MILSQVTLLVPLVERETYQQLSDDGMLPSPVTCLLLNEVDDHIEKAEGCEISAEEMGDRERPELDRLWRRLLVRARRLLGRPRPS
jgi:hypothetical protein